MEIPFWLVVVGLVFVFIANKLLTIWLYKAIVGPRIKKWRNRHGKKQQQQQ